MLRCSLALTVFIASLHAPASVGADWLPVKVSVPFYDLPGIHLLLNNTDNGVSIELARPRLGFALLRVSADGLKALSVAGVRWVPVSDESAHPLRSPDIDPNVAAVAESPSWDVYHTNDELFAILRSLAATYPKLASVHELGKTALGTPLLAIRISSYHHRRSDSSSSSSSPSRVRESVLIPGVKLVGNMHGDETLGREVLLRLAHFLLTGYGKNESEAALVDSVDLWILPSMNPDGYASQSRYNSRGVDLNRDFPDRNLGGVDSEAGRQSETAAIMRWATSVGFTLAMNLHGGAVVANVPYDSNPGGQSGLYTPSPDDAFFASVAKMYADTHPTMHLSTEFPGGWTNGCAWYVAYGGMQDWDYVYRDVFEVTVEMSDAKSPSPSTLQAEWDANRGALLRYIAVASWCGVRGRLFDNSTGQPVANGTIHVAQINKVVRTYPSSNVYFRLLTAGTYTIWATASGYYQSGPASVVIPPSQSSPVVVDLALVASPTVSQSNARGDGSTYRPDNSTNAMSRAPSAVSGASALASSIAILCILKSFV